MFVRFFSMLFLQLSIFPDISRSFTRIPGVNTTITGIYILLRERCVEVASVVRYYRNIARIGTIHICSSGFYHVRASFRTFQWRMPLTCNDELWTLLRNFNVSAVDTKPGMIFDSKGSMFGINSHEQNLIIVIAASSTFNSIQLKWLLQWYKHWCFIYKINKKKQQLHTISL